MRAWFVGLVAVVVVLVAGCGTLDRAYRREVVWAPAPVVSLRTNVVLSTNLVARVEERTNIVYLTNNTTGAVSRLEMRVPVRTNLVPTVEAQLVPVWVTNWGTVSYTNLVERPGALVGIESLGGVVNTFAPGVGSIVALVLGGLYHGYRQLRNRKVTEALVQGVETARAVLETTPQGQAADAEFVRWLKEHQREAGVLVAVAGLVDQVTDNAAARAAAAEILARSEAARGKS